MIKSKLILLSFFVVFMLSSVFASQLGDVDLDNDIDQEDITQLSAYIFEGVEIPQDVNVDLNCDSILNIIDVTFLVNYVNRGAEAPSCDIELNDYVDIYHIKINEVLVDGNPITVISDGTAKVNVYFISLVYDTDVRIIVKINGDSTETEAHSDNFDIEEDKYYRKYLDINVPQISAEEFQSIINVEVDGKNGKQLINVPIIIKESYSCADSNGDEVIDQSDLDAITSYAFDGVEIPEGANIDLNDDGVVDILDVVLMTNYVKRGASRPTCQQLEEPVFITPMCGDSNGDSILDQMDLNAITSYAFGGESVPVNVNADLNADGVIDILDVTLMINHVNRNESAPTCQVLSDNSDDIINEVEDIEEDVNENEENGNNNNNGGGNRRTSPSSGVQYVTLSANQNGNLQEVVVDSNIDLPVLENFENPQPEEIKSKSFLEIIFNFFENLLGFNTILLN